MESGKLTYPGKELDLFKHATTWKNYWLSKIKPFVRGDVIEVGAGIGANLPFFLSCTRLESYVGLEPDASLFDRLEALTREQVRRGVPVTARRGFLRDDGGELWCDTLAYIDVLEHIQDDREEVEAAAKRLRPGGHLIALCPSFPSLYSDFDRSVGHFRRYTRESLLALAPATLTPVTMRYLDSVGFMYSAMNRLFARQSQPRSWQITLWDKLLVPLSRDVTDPILSRWFGRSVLGVWQMESPGRSVGVSHHSLE